MVKITITADVRESKGGFSGAIGRVQQAVPKVLENSANRLRDRTQSNIRERAYKTGAMHDSTEASQVNEFQWEVTVGGGDVDYARYQEEGTIYIAPRRFFADAIADERAEFEGHVRREITAAIEG